MRVLLAWFVSALAAANLSTVQQPPPTPHTACEPTRSNGHAVAWSTLPHTIYDHGTDTLSTNLPPDGRLVFGAGHPGTILPDGKLRIKFLWFKERVPMLLTGRQLDGDGVLKAEINHAFDTEGFQPSFLLFSGPGCWQVTARAGQSVLTFVTDVQRKS